MQLYPQNLESKIGFDKIKELIRAECLSILGTRFVDKVAFSDDFKLISKLLEQTEEFRSIIVSGEFFPESNFIDINPYLEKAKIEGSFLLEEELHEVKLALSTLHKCLRFFEGKEEAYPQLYQLSGAILFEDNLLKAIESKIDEKGHVRNNASRELAEVRSRLSSSQVRLRKVLDQIMRTAREQGYTPDDASLTIRGGRMVIPVLAEHKRKLKGFIHDESATGQTVFMEPAEVLDINNEIKELEYLERREINKILMALTNQLRPHIQDLRRAFYFLGMMDFIRAKARLALKLNASLPKLEKTRVIEWYDARHPLLMLSLSQQGRSIVPLNLALNHNKRILMISGPNAGGKSVTLKTVALIQYMLQSGLLVPLASHSTVGIFQNIFIDIGDEQSIENDLSTYSSHLHSMKFFTQFADKKTLFLIDEFGTGTEPAFGGAIAEAILDQLSGSGAFGVVTTHYGNLKQMANNNPNLVNGAMRYDVDKLEPLYELEIGKPGSSFALEIARKIGLSGKIIEEAKSKIGDERVNYDRLLTKLENEKGRLAAMTKEASKKEVLLAKQMEEYASLKKSIDAQRKTLINDAKIEAKRLLQEANQKIEKTIREIKEKKADKAQTKEVRSQLQQYEKSLKPEAKPMENAPDVKVLDGPIEIGDHVRIKDNGAIGEVLGVKGKDVELLIGDLKTNVKLSRLEKVSKKEVKKQTTRVKTNFDSTKKMMDFSSNLDLRGKRGEEALFEIQQFVDEGYMLGLRELRIVHGKGDGILREICRNLLHKMPNVKRFQDEHADRGGAGVTLVELK